MTRDEFAAYVHTVLMPAEQDAVREEWLRFKADVENWQRVLEAMGTNWMTGGPWRAQSVRDYADELAKARIDTAARIVYAIAAALEAEQRPANDARPAPTCGECVQRPTGWARWVCRGVLVNEHSHACKAFILDAQPSGECIHATQEGDDD